MLDVRRSLPFPTLLGRPTILELEGMGDDDDKAFLMGMVMTRLIEHRRVNRDCETLQHLVIEEAHRLLANTGPKQGGADAERDMKGKAVETLLTCCPRFGRTARVSSSSTRYLPNSRQTY